MISLYFLLFFFVVNGRILQEHITGDYPENSLVVEYGEGYKGQKLRKWVSDNHQLILDIGKYPYFVKKDSNVMYSFGAQRRLEEFHREDLPAFHRALELKQNPEQISIQNKKLLSNFIKSHEIVYVAVIPSMGMEDYTKQLSSLKQEYTPLLYTSFIKEEHELHFLKFHGFKTKIKNTHVFKVQTHPFKVLERLS